MSISLGQFGLVVGLEGGRQFLRMGDICPLIGPVLRGEVVSSLSVKVLKLGFDFMGAAYK